MMAAHPDDDLHVAGCPECQARAALAARDVDLGRAWRGVAAETWTEPAGAVERLAARLLGSPGLARALVTTPSLVLSWIAATAVVLAAGAVASRATGTPWVALLAPAVSGAGIAYAYGPGVDPAFELTQTTPISHRLVLLVRVLAVFGVNALLALVATLVAPEALALALGWLVPMTAVSALALAAATLARSANVGVAAALAGWAIVVLGSAVGTRDVAAAVEGGALLPLYLLAACGFAALALYGTSGRREGRIQWQ